MKHVFQENASLETLFIDTLYRKGDENQTEKFESYTQMLWDFAQKVEPFACKDVEVALTDLDEETVNNKILSGNLTDTIAERNVLKNEKSELEEHLKDLNETLKQKEDKLDETKTELKTEKAKTQNLGAINENLGAINEKLNEIKNKSSEAETIKMLEEVIQGLNGNVENLTAILSTKVIQVVEF